MIIKRPNEVKRLAEVKKWTLVFGRRKTGKSFLVENFISYDEYFFVNRDRTIISKKRGTQIGYDALIEIVTRDLKEGKTIVIDEFHRLGEQFLDTVHSIGHGGKLFLLTSTLFLAKKLLSARSPLLGLFHEAQIKLIDIEDTLEVLRNRGLSKQNLVEGAIMLREPITADYFNEKENIRKTFTTILTGSINTVPALIGEIFLEEERSLSATYEGIIRAVADGKVVSGEISSALYSRKLVPKDDPSTIQPYLNNLVKIGVLRRISVFGKKKFIYKIDSPLVRLFYYADEKYGIGQRQLSGIEAERILTDLFPHIVEDNIREHIANKFGLEETVVEAGDYDMDGVLIKFKRPSVLLGVKWKQKVSNEEIKRAEDTMSKIKANKKMLFVRDKTNLKSKILEIIDVTDL